MAEGRREDLLAVAGGQLKERAGSVGCGQKQSLLEI